MDNFQPRPLEPLDNPSEDFSEEEKQAGYISLRLFGRSHDASTAQKRIATSVFISRMINMAYKLRNTGTDFENLIKYCHCASEVTLEEVVIAKWNIYAANALKYIHTLTDPHVHETTFRHSNPNVHMVYGAQVMAAIRELEKMILADDFNQGFKQWASGRAGSEERHKRNRKIEAFVQNKMATVGSKRKAISLAVREFNLSESTIKTAAMNVRNSKKKMG